MVLGSEAGTGDRFMSSPLQTVNDVVGWINKVCGSKLPRLPFKGYAQILTELWNKIVPGALPNPTDSYPWNIPIKGKLSGILKGTKVELEDLSLRVQSDVPPLPPPISKWPPDPPASPPLPKPPQKHRRPPKRNETLSKSVCKETTK